MTPLHWALGWDIYGESCEPCSHEILDLTGNVEKYLHFITFIAKYNTIWGEIATAQFSSMGGYYNPKIQQPQPSPPIRVSLHLYSTEQS